MLVIYYLIREAVHAAADCACERGSKLVKIFSRVETVWISRLLCKQRRV